MSDIIGIAIPGPFAIPGFRDWETPIPGSRVWFRDWKLVSRPKPSYLRVQISSKSSWLMSAVFLTLITHTILLDRLTSWKQAIMYPKLHLSHDLRPIGLSVTPILSRIVERLVVCHYLIRVLAALLRGTPILCVSQTLRRWTEGATYIRQGGHHVTHWPTF